MSKILKELLAATGEAKQKRKEDDDAFLTRIVKAMHELDDDEWEELSKEAQDWFNDAAECANNKKQLPAMPGGEKAAKKPSKRTGKKDAKKDDAPLDGIEKGLEVVLYGKKGKVLAEGEVAEAGKKQVTILDDEGEEISVSLKRVVRFEIIDGGNEPEPAGDADGEEIEPEDIEVGQNVRLVVDDEEISGEVTKVKKKFILVGDEKVKIADIDEAYLSEAEASEPEPAGEDEEIEPEDIEKGQSVRLVVDEEDVSGEVTKVTKKAIFVDGTKYKIDDIGEAYLSEAEEVGSEDAGETVEPADVEKGMTVSIEMKNGDVVEGEVNRVASKNDEVKTIFVDGTRCAVSKIVSVSTSESDAGGEEESGDADGDDESADMVRDIICKFPKMKFEKIAKKVSKAKIEMDDDALEAIFNDTQTIIGMLKEHGKLA